MIRRVACLSLALLLAACHGRAEAPGVEKAWIRLPAVPGRPAAAYFTLVAGGGGAGDRLVKIESALAAKTEMHESMTGASGMTSMAPIASVDLPPHGRIAFRPGGRHAMLFGLDPVVTAGTAVPLRFGFASGRTAEAEAKTVPAGGDAPY